jgi:hypothetical protein
MGDGKVSARLGMAVSVEKFILTQLRCFGYNATAHAKLGTI